MLSASHEAVFMKLFRFSTAPLLALGATLFCFSGAVTRVQSRKVAPHFAPALSKSKKPVAHQAAPRRAASTRDATKAWLPAKLVIPKLKVTAPIVRGIDNAALRRGVGFDPDSSDAGRRGGNCVIAGHRNVWGSWFWSLPNLKKGDLVFIDTPRRRLTYRVQFGRVVQPSETQVLEAPADAGDANAAPRLTLYTCTKPKTDCRFIIVADLVKAANR